MTRLLIVGSDRPHAIEIFFVKYIKEFGITVKLFPASSIFHDYYYKNIFNKIKYRTGISTILGNINTEFKKGVEEFNPDVIWLFKGMEIFSTTLIWAKRKGIKLVNYNPDNPFIFTGRGSGNKQITNSLPLYDLHFTYSLEIEKQLKAHFTSRIELLPFAFDIPDTVYKNVNDQPEILKVCFLGNPDKQRVAFIKQLAAKGILIDVYGNNWQDFIDDPAVTIFSPVYELEFWKLLRQYRVQLNLMRVHNENAHNMRSFEVPAIGGIMLAPDTPEHRLFFEAGKEIFLFNNIEDCVEGIHYLLGISREAADKIRQAALARSIQSEYSYRDRSKQVVKEIKSLYV